MSEAKPGEVKTPAAIRSGVLDAFALEIKRVVDDESLSHAARMERIKALGDFGERLAKVLP